MRLILLTIVLTTFSAFGADLSKVDVSFYANFNDGVEMSYEAVLEDSLLMRDKLDPKAKYYASQNNEFLVKAIDEVFIRTVMTANGVEICRFLGTEKKFIKKDLGVSDWASSVIAKICKKQVGVIDRTTEGKVNKKYIFVIGGENKLSLDSWTTMMNTTFIFLNNIEAKSALYERVLHEFYIGLDQKFLLGKVMALDVRAKKIQRLFYSMELNFKPINKVPFNIGVNKELDELMGLVPFPLLKSSTQVIRAKIFEEKILTEIDRDYVSYYHENVENDCESVLEMVMTSMFDLQDYLLPFEYNIIPVEYRKDAAQGLYLNEKGPQIFADEFRDMSIHFKHKEEGYVLSACQYLAEPTLGLTSSFYTRGPRPRIKTGWSNIKPGQDIKGVFEAENFQRDFLESDFDKQSGLGMNQTFDEYLDIKEKNENKEIFNDIAEFFKSSRED